MSFEIHPGADGADLVMTGEWSAAAREELVSGRVDGLVLNYALGWPPQPIDFIEGLPIRRMNLLARSIDDLNAIHSLSSTLVELRVQAHPRAVIELERLPLVRTLSASWSQVCGSIMFAHQIEDLSVPSYSEEDLSPLEPLSALTRLVMKERPRLRRLNGVESFPWLAHLGIHLARNLDDITALRRVSSPTLQVLQLTYSKKIADIEAVAALTSLRFLDLSEGGEIPTVAPLSGLVCLEELYMYGSTRIADCDLTPIARLPRLIDLKLMNRRGYKPPVQEIKDNIARRATT